MDAVEKKIGPQVVSVVIPRPLHRVFTYEIPENFSPFAQVGQWVKVPFGNGSSLGFIVESPHTFEEEKEKFSSTKLKSLLEIGSEDTVLPEEIVKLCKWVSQYYFSPLGEVLQTAASTADLGLKTQSRKVRDFFSNVEPLSHPTPLVTLTSTQQQVVDAILALPKNAGTLLEGVTGSGKTEVYIEVAREILKQGQTVLIIVPEIALTPQLFQRFQTRLGEAVGVWHSAVAAGRRRDQWAALKSGKLRVLVGARSAVFAPLKNLGLIVVDEEHDATFKQEDRVRYHARDVAIVRAKNCGAKTILGSATPSLESLHRAREKKISHFFLTQRVGQASMPDVEIVDLTREPTIPGLQTPFAERTLQTLKDVLARGEQAMIFLNKRGFASVWVCESCGHSEQCVQCSISLTYHKYDNTLKCHLCGLIRKPPMLCNKCDSAALKMLGGGTESLEEELQNLVPQMRIARLDRDQVTSASRLEKILDDFRQGKSNVLLGTQMLVKGHDFPNVTLVVVALADLMFRFPDFRAAERSLQTLVQVSGRAGRALRPGRVLIQTYYREHPVLQVAIGKSSKSDFLDYELKMRKDLHYPPYARLARIRAESLISRDAKEFLKGIVDGLRTFPGVEVLGPAEAFIAKVKGLYRWDLLLKTQRIEVLQQALHRVNIYVDSKRTTSRSVSMHTDMDPYQLF